MTYASLEITCSKVEKMLSTAANNTVISHLSNRHVNSTTQLFPITIFSEGKKLLKEAKKLILAMFCRLHQPTGPTIMTALARRGGPSCSPLSPPRMPSCTSLITSHAR